MKTVLISHAFMIIMLFPLFGKTQLVTISGNITHSESGEAMENVTVFESFSNIGTITNSNGFFRLLLLQGALEIKITKDGFNEFAQQLILNNDTTFAVKLEPEIHDKNRNKKQGILHADAKSTKKIFAQRRDSIK